MSIVFLAFKPPAFVMSDFRACITYFIRDMSLPAALLLVEKSQFSLTRSHGFLLALYSSTNAKKFFSFSAFVIYRCPVCFFWFACTWASTSSAFCFFSRFRCYSSSYLR